MGPYWVYQTMFFFFQEAEHWVRTQYLITFSWWAQTSIFHLSAKRSILIIISHSSARSARTNVIGPKCASWSKNMTTWLMTVMPAVRHCVSANATCCGFSETIGQIRPVRCSIWRCSDPLGDETDIEASSAVPILGHCHPILGHCRNLSLLKIEY